MFSVSILLLVAALLTVSCAQDEVKPCNGAHVAKDANGTSIKCGRGTKGAEGCPGYEEDLGYCDIDPADRFAVCCIKEDASCTEVKCPKGTECVEEKDENGVVSAECVQEEECTGVLQKGRCYEPSCLPSAKHHRGLDVAVIQCEKKEGFVCKTTGKHVRCEQIKPTLSVKQEMVTKLPEVEPDVSTTSAPTPTPVSCKPAKKYKDDVKCEDPFVKDKNDMCTHKRCVTRREGEISACEKKGKHYCVTDEMGRVDCQPCKGTEMNSLCIVDECVKSDMNAFTICEETGGECQRIRHAVMCINKLDDKNDTSCPLLKGYKEHNEDNNDDDKDEDYEDDDGYDHDKDKPGDRPKPDDKTSSRPKPTAVPKDGHKPDDKPGNRPTVPKDGRKSGYGRKPDDKPGNRTTVPRDEHKPGDGPKPDDKKPALPKDGHKPGYGRKPDSKPGDRSTVPKDGPKPSPKLRVKPVGKPDGHKPHGGHKPGFGHKRKP